LGSLALALEGLLTAPWRSLLAVCSERSERPSSERKRAANTASVA